MLGLPMTKIALSNLFKKAATRKYPFVVRKTFEATRGRISIDYDKCIHCGACDRRCPSQAIKVIREPKSWQIDRFKCVTCNLCVEICPKKCLFMEKERTKVFVGSNKLEIIEKHTEPSLISDSEKQK